MGRPARGIGAQEKGRAAESATQDACAACLAISGACDGEIARGAAFAAALRRAPRALRSVPRELRIHLNQYRDDIRTLKASNAQTRPFENADEL